MAYAMTKRGSLDNCVTYEFICDTVEDMDAIENRYRTIGTVAIVLQGSSGLEVYIAGSDKQWNNLGAMGSSSTAGLSIHICGQDEISEGLPNISEPEENTIYLTPAESSETGNLYEEYIYVNNNWEKFGSGSIDLSTYALKSELPDISGKANKTDTVLDTTLSCGREAGTVVGAGSIAFGYDVAASGDYSHAEGENTIALGYAEHVSGTYNIPDTAPVWAANTSYAINDLVIYNDKIYKCKTANNDATFTLSKWDESGQYLVVVGNGTSNNIKSNAYTLDWNGNETIAGSLYLNGNIASNNEYNEATGQYSIALGTGETINSVSSKNTLSGDYSIAIGHNDNTVSGNYSIGIGTATNIASGNHSLALGQYGNQAIGDYSIAIGSNQNKTLEDFSIAIGTATNIASEQYSIALGKQGNYASEQYSVAIGESTNTASGQFSIALGKYGNLASGQYAVAIGNSSNTASGTSSVALGNAGNLASGSYSLALGNSGNTASGQSSLALGMANMCGGDYSYAHGYGLLSPGLYQHSIGTYNISDTISNTWTASTSYTVGTLVKYNNKIYKCKTANSDVEFTPSKWEHTTQYFITVGNGTPQAHKNIYTLDANGNEFIAGSMAQGSNVKASGDYSHAEGEGGSYIISGTSYTSGAYGTASHSEGRYTNAGSEAAHSEGKYTRAGNTAAHAEGQYTIAKGTAAHAEGYSTIASGNYSHAEGWGEQSFTLNNTTYAPGAYGYAAHAEGYSTRAEAQGAHAEGNHTVASGTYTHAEGQNTIASASYAHAEGYSTQATGRATHAEGQDTTASGWYSHAEGESTVTSGYAAHAEGYNTTASDVQAHAEGYSTTASNARAHAEGESTVASGTNSHAEGESTVASGYAAHAGGIHTTASGGTSYAEGGYSVASGDYTHAEGYQTIAAGPRQHVSGQCNVSDTTLIVDARVADAEAWVADTEYSVGDMVTRTFEPNTYYYVCITANNDSTFTNSKWALVEKHTSYLEIIGNGLAPELRSNTRALDWEGNEYLMGDIYVGCNTDSTGGTKLPRIPMPPTTDGTYTLQATVTNGTPTYSWI